MNTKSFLICFIVVMLATSMATAVTHHGYGAGYYGNGYYGNGYSGAGYYGNGYYPSSYYRGYGYNGNRSRVVRLQQQLARAGYYRGPIDGIMGSRTRYALRAYQHDHGTASL